LYQYEPGEGVTTPPLLGAAAMVSMYCVPYVAVSVWFPNAQFTVIVPDEVEEATPFILMLLKSKRVPRLL
jgi:hypothetical protein